MIKDYIIEIAKTIGQRDDERWRPLRYGRMTSSEIENLVSDPKSGTGLSVKAIDYIESRFITGVTQYESNPYSYSLQWGKEKEAEVYEILFEKYGESLIHCGFIANMYGYEEIHGGSPDGAILSIDAALEIKCPYNSVNHFNYVRYINSVETLKKHYKKAYWQLVSNAYLIGSDNCLFVSYDPRFIDTKVKHYLEIEFKTPSDDVELLMEKLPLAKIEYNKLKELYL